MKKIIVILTFFTFFYTYIHAKGNSGYFIGINPSVTVEPFYNKGEYDINIFPLVYEKPFTENIGLRLGTILNLGIRDNGNRLSHYGVETALPISLFNGFYMAPVISATRNNIELHENLGLWIETGYGLNFENNFSLVLGLQLGETYFNYDNDSSKWDNHFGFKAIIGKWFN